MPEPVTLEQSDLLKQLHIDRGPDRPPRRRGRLLAILVLVLLVGGVALWLGWGRLRPPVVQTTVARAAAPGGGAGSVLDASGYVTARLQATVSAKITGKVTEVLIEEGMRVREGAVLARLDDTEARAALGLAQAQLVAARSQLAEVRAQLEQAERDYVRQQGLYDRQLVSPQSLDAALAQRDMLRARLANLQEQIKVAQESVAVAQVQLDNTVIRAPFSGVVIAKSAQPGEMISPISAGGGFTRTGIGTIVDMDSLEIQVDVNESYINRVTPGQPVEATLNAYPDWKIPGEVIAIIPTADRSKATVKVRIAIKTRDPRIVPDMGVRVGFLESKPAGRGAGAGGRGGAGAGRGGTPRRRRRDRLRRDRRQEGGAPPGDPGPGRRPAQRRVVSGLREGERVVLAPPRRPRGRPGGAARGEVSART